MNTAIAHTLVCFALITITGCASVTRNPLPLEEYAGATVLGQQGLRVWGDNTELENTSFQLQNHSMEDFKARYAGVSGMEHNYLAISGGGANGAFGAGALVGWSETGNRPEFTIVTGVSTGALLAPFAFLGLDYDAQMRKVYTTSSTEDIFKRRSVFNIVGNDGLVDSTPLLETLRSYVTDAMIAEIAAEHRKGRLLLIGTTNLDAGRPVVWNIGRIAATGHPDAPELIRNILRASASIPGAFPPVYLPVQSASGDTYDEMHVDGGAASQMFLYPSSVDWHDVMEALNVQGKPKAYVIRNARVQPEYEAVPPRLSSIAARTIDSLIRTQGVGDGYRIYATTKRDGVEAYVTWITMDAVEDTSEEPFDPKYMSILFDYGYQRAVKDELWHRMEFED